MKKIADVVDENGNILITYEYEDEDDRGGQKRIGGNGSNNAGINNNTNTRKKSSALALIGITVIVVVIIVMIFLIMRNSNDNTGSIDVELNGNITSTHANKTVAIDNATLIAETDPSYIRLDMSSFGEVRIQLDGQDSGTHFFAETNDEYEETGIYTPGETGVLAIKFSLEDFDEGEIVLVTFTFNTNNDDLFNHETQYFAFIIGGTS